MWQYYIAVYVLADLSRHRRRWSDGVCHLAGFSTLCAGCNVRIHRNRTLQQDKARSGADDSFNFSSQNVIGLLHRNIGVSGSVGVSPTKHLRYSRNMFDSFARSNVHRQRNRGVEKSDPARQARNRPLVTHSHADSIHRPAVVVNPNLNKKDADAPRSAVRSARIRANPWPKVLILRTCMFHLE